MALLCEEFCPRILKIVFQGMTPGSFQNHIRFIAFTKSAFFSAISFLLFKACCPFPKISVFCLCHVVSTAGVSFGLFFEVKQL